MSTRLPSLKSLRLRARKLRRSDGFSLTEALSRLAMQYSYPSWDALLFDHPETAMRRELEVYSKRYLHGYTIKPDVELSQFPRHQFTFYDFLEGKFREYRTDELERCLSSYDDSGELELCEYHFRDFERHLYNQIYLMHRQIVRTQRGYDNHTVYDLRNGYSAYFYLNIHNYSYNHPAISPNEQGPDGLAYVELSELDPTRFDYGPKARDYEGYVRWRNSPQARSDTMSALEHFVNACALTRVVTSIRFLPGSGAEKRCRSFLPETGWRFDGQKWLFTLNNIHGSRNELTLKKTV